MSAREFYRKFHDQVLIVHAHPYRDGNTTVFEDAVHGTEILNAHPRHENHNDRALELAKRHPEYLRLAGSDTHEDGDECRAGVLLPERVRIPCLPAHDRRAALPPLVARLSGAGGGG